MAPNVFDRLRPPRQGGGTLGEWGRQIEKITRDPAGYFNEVAEKMKNLPAEFDQARLTVMNALAPNIIVKLMEAMAASSEKITIGMNNEEKLRITITDQIDAYKASEGSSAVNCPSGISSFVITQLAMKLPPDDPYLKFVVENAPRIAQEVCSQAYA
ncbi:hypothetical protein [Paenibacillus polymyxa]|uniref:hypothetical protein n=1 Tax=Paenibacillus polymyxa TaxID=1406 RepID=UPI00177C00EB|nr:hypothetical protein [Paenibacillus polymyxa]QOH62400.1 hypothetical protein DI243_13840 [Paenibacillus polymyxa]